MAHFPRILLLLSVLLTLGAGLNAQTLSEYRKQHQAVMNEIKKNEEALNSNKKSLKNLLYQFNTIDKKVKESEKYLSQLKEEYQKTELELSSLQKECRQIEEDIKSRSEQYAKMVRQLYLKLGDNDKLMFIFSAQDFGQSLRRIRYLNEYSRYERRQAETLKEKKAELERLQAQLLEKQQLQASLLAEQENENNLLSKERSRQDSMVRDMKQKGNALNSELKRQQQKAEKLNRQIEKIIAEENRKSQPKDGKNRTAETVGGYAMTVDEKKLADEFGKNKGALPFPVSQPGHIIVHYGQQKHLDMKYVQTNSNGIDIQTSAGASAKSIFKGEVSKIFSVQGSNYSIIVRHGNYLSVYSNIDQVNVKTGQKVKTGEILGRIYTDNEQGGLTILQLQVWKDLQRLDPEEWLKRL